MFDIIKSLFIPKNCITAVVDGELMPLTSVKDEVFSKKLMGDGVAIKPSKGLVVSPVFGTVTMLFPTKHSFGITMENGIQILIHIGLDTVNLNGRGFNKLVDVGTKVKIGTPIIKFDELLLKNNEYDMTTMMIFTSCDDFNLDFNNQGKAIKGKTIVAKYKRKE